MPAAHFSLQLVPSFLSCNLSYLMCTKCVIAMALCVLSVRFKQKLNCVSNVYAYMLLVLFFFAVHICDMVMVEGGGKQKITDR